MLLKQSVRKGVSDVLRSDLLWHVKEACTLQNSRHLRSDFLYMTVYPTEERSTLHDTDQCGLRDSLPL